MLDDACYAYPSSQPNKEEAEDTRKPLYLQRYHLGGFLAEAAIIGNEPVFLISRASNPSKIEVVDEIEYNDDEVLKPLDISGYMSLAYKFSSKDGLVKFIEKVSKNETLDSLYRKNKILWRKYVDGDDFHISISAADEIYTYIQEKIGLTHYLFYIGDNDVGKSNNLTKIHYTAYRNMLSTDMTED